MIKFKKKDFPLYLLNGIGIIVYVTVFFNLNTTVSKEIAFSASDAITYLDVANWLDLGIDSESVSTRPILYPLLLLITTKLGGVYALWIIQSIFWLLSVNFIFLAIKQLTKRNGYAYLGAFLLMSNLSLIALTLHALTEVTTVFLLAMMLFFMIKKMDQFREPHFIHTCLFFLVLLTLVKPVFSIPLFSILLIVFPLVYLRKHLNYPKHFIRLLLIMLPILLQLTIIKVKYGQTKISLIGSTTFTKYFVAQGIQKIESIDRDASVKKALSLSKKEQKDYVYQHLPVYSQLFKMNITDNITGRSTFLLYPAGYENHRLADVMQSYNNVTLKVHYIFCILLIPLLFILLRKKDFPMLILLTFLFTLGFYYIIVTGISFFQGDRLTLSAIAIWTCLYPLILFNYMKLIYPKKYKIA